MDYWSLLTGSMVCIESFPILNHFLDRSLLFTTASTDHIFWHCAVFDSCFSTEVLPQGMYPVYLNEILTELHEEHVESSFLAINFRDGDKRSQFADILREYNIPVIDYPRHFEGCPVLPLSLIQHFLRVCEHWLSSGNNKNIILLHCERGTWPLLAFFVTLSSHIQEIARC